MPAAMGATIRIIDPQEEATYPGDNDFCPFTLHLANGTTRSKLPLCTSLGNKDVDMINLDGPFPEVKHLIMTTHGLGYDTRKYQRILRQAAVIAGRRESTAIVATLWGHWKYFAAFGIKNDTRESWLLYQWTNTKGWPAGVDSHNPTGLKLSSYEVYELMLHEFTNCTKYPNLQTISITGHSAGGSFVDRFVSFSSVLEQVNNNSYYAAQVLPAGLSYFIYYDDVRPKNPATVGERGMTFVNVTNKQCEGFNRWPYGTNMRSSAPRAVRNLSKDTIRRRHFNLCMTYLVGNEDLSEDKKTCMKKLQGYSRRLKLQFYNAYVLQYYKETMLTFGNVTFYRQPGYQHDGEQLWSDLAVRLLFNNERLRAPTKGCSVDSTRKLDMSHMPRGVAIRRV